MPLVTSQLDAVRSPGRWERWRDQGTDVGVVVRTGCSSGSGLGAVDQWLVAHSSMDHAAWAALVRQVAGF